VVKLLQRPNPFALLPRRFLRTASLQDQPSSTTASIVPTHNDPRVLCLWELQNHATFEHKYART
jgi:hypothetical protein